MPFRIHLRFGIIASLIAGILSIANAQLDHVVGLAEVHRLDLLPRFKDSIKVGSFSSYDRTGGNDDGFSGKYSFLRKEGDGLVIAEMNGPGAIYRIWTPTPTDDPMEFYFDGESEPRIRMTFRELFQGDKPPFIAPLVGNGGGGFYNYVPLPFGKSCKVVIRGPKVQFYQINYALYPPGHPVQTYSADQWAASTADLERARKLLESPGADISPMLAPADSKVQMDRVRKTLVPGKTIRLWEAKSGGRILGLRLSPASAFEGKDRAVSLRITWDKEKQPAVDCPVGDFFGYAWGKPAMRSVPLGTIGETDYVYLPMPFDRSARVELRSERESGESIPIQAEIIHSDLPRRPDEGRFYAIWNRENPTTIGKPFTYVETTGRGHVVGVMLQAQGFVPGITPFFEGDDQCTIDGEMAAHGTGSEDFFNGGWYDVPGRWEGRVSFPLSGCLEYNRPMARSGGYRFFLTDAYAYRKSILLAMEHAPEKNDIATDYTAVTFLYSENPPTMSRTLPTLAARAVQDPQRLVYTPGWYVPLHSYSLQNATLTKKDERIDGRGVRYLSMRATGSDVFGEHHLSLLCDVPAAGRYRVTFDAVEGPQQAIVQLYYQERSMGAPVDLYAEAKRRGKPIEAGVLDMREGPNQVFFKLVGKNPKSEGLGFDLITVTLERLP